MKVLIFDIETDGLLDTVSKVHCLVIRNAETGSTRSYADQKGYRPIREGLESLARADLVVGHNIINFDLPVLERLHGLKVPIERVRDTMVLSRLYFADIGESDKKKRHVPSKLRGTHSLKSWGYRLGILKGEFSDTEDETIWETWTEEMQEYCEQDVRVTSRLWFTLKEKITSDFAVNLEHRFAALIQKQMEFGFAFDTAAAVELFGTLLQRREDLARQLKEEFPPKRTVEIFVPQANNSRYGYVKGVPVEKVKVKEFNPGSRDQIGERLMELGWVPEEWTSTGKPKVAEETLSGLEDVSAAQSLIEYFLVDKRQGQVGSGEQAWLKVVQNGRIHGYVNTLGTVTRRCTHSKPNVSQVPAVDKPYGPECRALFQASLGVLVGADLEGIELRCLAHFMSKYDGGAYRDILLEGDIHWANVRAAGWCDEEKDEENLLHKVLRKHIKTWFYGFLYGSGDLKSGLIIYKTILAVKAAGCDYRPMLEKFFNGKMQVTDSDLKLAGKRMKDQFLKGLPALKQVIDAVKRKAKVNGYILAIDGEKLPVRHQHAALNTLLQSTGSLVAKLAAVLAEEELCSRGFQWKKDFAFVANIHDEVQVDCRAEIADEVGQVIVDAMRRAGEEFGMRCRIDGKYQIGKNWKETH